MLHWRVTAFFSFFPVEKSKFLLKLVGLKAVVIPGVEIDGKLVSVS
jgi:hypothetical protein